MAGASVAGPVTPPGSSWGGVSKSKPRDDKWLARLGIKVFWVIRGGPEDLKGLKSELSEPLPQFLLFK